MNDDRFVTPGQVEEPARDISDLPVLDEDDLPYAQPQGPKFPTPATHRSYGTITGRKIVPVEQAPGMSRNERRRYAKLHRKARLAGKL